MNALWSFVLPTIACIGLWLQSSKNRLGWAINASAQILWATYGLVSDQIGYTLFAVIFFTINVRGFANWKPTADCTCTCVDHKPVGELA